jgi:hypothetical protein
MTRIATLPLPTELPGPGPFLLVTYSNDYEHATRGSFDKIVRDIRYGHIDPDSIETIYELSPRDGTMSEITITIARAVHLKAANLGYPVTRSLARWLDSYLQISVNNEPAWRELVGAG